MSDPYLSIRRMKDGSVRLYAVKSGWDSVKKKAIKEYQIYIGGKKPDGTYTFNEKTQEFLFLLRNMSTSAPSISGRTLSRHSKPRSR